MSKRLKKDGFDMLVRVIENEHAGDNNLGDIAHEGLLGAIAQAREANALRARVTTLEGIQRADDARLLAASEKVGIPPSGCDTADDLADEVLALRARVAELTEALEDALWQATATDYQGRQVYGHQFTSAYEAALALLVRLGRARYVEGHNCYGDPVPAQDAEKGGGS